MNQKLIVFDLGRVLVRICDTWQQACKLAEIVDGDWRDLDVNEKARLTEIIHAFDTGRVDLATFARDAGKLRGLSAEQVIAMNQHYTLGPFPGAAELVDDLHAAGHVTACLSNTNPNHWRMFCDAANEHNKVVSRLRHRFASHLMGVRKPDAAIYERVECETGVAPERIIFFDDMAENVAAAQARGWRAHLVEICENPIPSIRRHLRDGGVL